VLVIVDDRRIRLQVSIRARLHAGRQDGNYNHANQ
jgi:hypothetical protein